MTAGSHSHVHFIKVCIQLELLVSHASSELYILAVGSELSHCANIHEVFVCI